MFAGSHDVSHHAYAMYETVFGRVLLLAASDARANLVGLGRRRSTSDCESSESARTRASVHRTGTAEQSPADSAGGSAAEGKLYLVKSLMQRPECI